MNYWATEYLRTKTASWMGRVGPSALAALTSANPLAIAPAIGGAIGYPTGIEQGIQQAREAGTPIDPDTIQRAGLGHGMAQLARMAIPMGAGAFLGEQFGHHPGVGAAIGAGAATPWLYSASKNRALEDVQRAVDVNESQRSRVNVVNNMPPQMTPEQLAAFHQELLTRMGQGQPA